MKKLIWLAALLAGCAAEGNAVNLTIVADGSVGDASLQKVRSLTIRVSGVQTSSKTYPLGSLPKQERVQLLPTVSTGKLDIAVTAVDGQSTVLAAGMTSVTLTGKTVPASITLSAQVPVVVAVTPPSATVTRGHTQQFTANGPVVWKVTGGDGNGTIDANGLYTAPATPGGPFTVVATSMLDDSNGTSASVNVVDYRVELLAGGLGGGGEADGTGAGARFAFPNAIASDGQGNLYVSDLNGCTIRKIDLSNNAVTTLGGVPGECANTDGKLGQGARFSMTRALAIDSTGTILFVAGQPNVIRKIALTTGDVTTVTVGAPPGTPPAVSGIVGVAYDTAANTLYYSSQGQHVIRKITLNGTPADTLLAGTAGSAGSADAPSGPGSMASFHSPQQLAIDGAGSVWVADRDNALVRKIVPASGAVTTVAGKPGMKGSTDGTGSAALFDSPFGISFNPNNNTMYVSEAYSGVVRSVSAGGNVVTLAGVPRAQGTVDEPVADPAHDAGRGVNATFGYLQGLTYDAATAALYVTEYDNGIIRGVGLNASNAVTTIAGTQPALGYHDGPGTTALFWSLGTVANDGKVVYIADNSNAVIRTYDLTTGVVATIAGQAGKHGGDDGPAAMATFDRPEGLFIDGNTLFITDGNASTLRKLDLTSNVVSTVAGQYRSSGTNDGVGPAARFYYPAYVVGDRADHLFITDFTNTVRRFTISTGEVKTVAGAANMPSFVDNAVGTDARFAGGYGIAIDGHTLYVCDASAQPNVRTGAALRTVDLDTFAVGTVAGSFVEIGSADGMTGAQARLNGCTAMVADGHGHIYFGDAGLLRKLDVQSTAVSTVAGKPSTWAERPGALGAATLNNISGLTVLPSGDIVFDDGGESDLILVRAP